MPDKVDKPGGGNRWTSWVAEGFKYDSRKNLKQQEVAEKCYIDVIDADV